MDNLELYLMKELEKLEFNVSKENITKLIKFVQLLHQWNKTYNLTSVRNPKDMIIKHIIDSLVVSPYLKGNSFVDVGTGPGLPGIPLAIINPDKKFCLLDSQTKRINFIRFVKRQLNIVNIEPLLGRSEELKEKNSEILFDGVLSRAFASLKEMLLLCKDLIDDNGFFIALKGQLSDSELNEIPVEFVVSDIIKLNVPISLGSRHVVLVNKRKGLL
jgi:16S rRNA (guanine527-N7)-methyltransferase